MEQKLKVETWCGHDIRFIEKGGDWWAILKDVCDALDLDTRNVSRQLIRQYEEDDVYSKHVTESDDKKSEKDEILARTTKGEAILAKRPFPDALGRLQPTYIVAELGIYDVIFQSRKKEAREFKEWVFGVIRELRKQSGLNSYEAFRMTDKEIQKAATDRLYKITHPESNVPIIKANTITNKAIANMYGEPKAIPKGKMTPEMLKDRQAVYDDTINLMIAQQAFDLDLSISKAVYEKYSEKKVIKK